jgi:serine/threonine protein kinase
MAAHEEAIFSGLVRFKLTEVTVLEDRGSELGRGAFARIVQLDYKGLKCAGKKINEKLKLRRRRGDDSYGVRRFEEECLIHSQLHHPNVVQFLGVHFQHGVQAPILVMEFLPTNLTSRIEQYKILPTDVNCSILHDVALALRYIHSQTPPIIHRDLSSNNILLTPNMTAKICDFGNAKRLVENDSAGAPKLMRNPGTITFMPPESLMANPVYDTSIDEFSYGVIMVHVFSGEWPSPEIGPSYTEPDGTVIAATEADRRKVLLDRIGRDHPLMDLILKCLHNYPPARPHASEIVARLQEAKIMSQDLSRLEKLERPCCAEDKAEKKAIREKII